MTRAEKRALADQLFTEILDPRGRAHSAWPAVIKLLVLITDELWGPGETKVEEWQ